MAKYCLGCNADKEESDFNRNRAESDGLQRWCRECMSKYLKEWNNRPTEKAARKEVLELACEVVMERLVSREPQTQPAAPAIRQAYKERFHEQPEVMP